MSFPIVIEVCRAPSTPTKTPVQSSIVEDSCHEHMSVRARPRLAGHNQLSVTLQTRSRDRGLTARDGQQQLPIAIKTTVEGSIRIQLEDCALRVGTPADGHDRFTHDENRTIARADDHVLRFIVAVGIRENSVITRLEPEHPTTARCAIDEQRSARWRKRRVEGAVEIIPDDAKIEVFIGSKAAEKERIVFRETHGDSLTSRGPSRSSEYIHKS